MFKASQQAVIQEANIQLVGIRYAEIQYFAQFFSTFGTQCFLLAGFICGAVSQTPAFGANCNYFWQILYNISSASCIALATMGLLISVFISVFGQGLAIRGPPGSMIRAVEGMVVEQYNAMALFVGAAISYVLQEIGMFFVMMDTWSAVACTIAVSLGSLYTYHVVVRIYNRFYFSKESVANEWNDSHDPAAELSELDPSLLTKKGSDRSTAGTAKGSSKSGMHSTLLVRQDALNTSDKKEKSTLGKVVSKVQKTVGLKSSSSAAQRQSELSEQQVHATIHNYADNPYYDGASAMSDAPYIDLGESSFANANNTNNANANSPLNTNSSTGELFGDSTSKVAGYLTVKGKKSFGGFSDPWERRYFVLRDNLIFYYKDKRSFELDPQTPINKRPIDLEGYTLVAGAVEPPFAISLVPLDPEDVRKAWKFRCDTMGEFQSWVQSFTRAISKCSGSNAQGMFVNALHSNNINDDNQQM